MCLNETYAEFRIDRPLYCLMQFIRNKGVPYIHSFCISLYNILLGIFKKIKWDWTEVRSIIL
jgi:hypothetical protein